MNMMIVMYTYAIALSDLRLLGSGLRKEGGHLLVAVHGGDAESGGAVSSGHVDDCTSIQERLHHLKLAGVARCHERSATVLLGLIRFSTRCEQGGDDALLTELAGEIEECLLVLDGSERGATIDHALYHLQVLDASVEGEVSTIKVHLSKLDLAGLQLSPRKHLANPFMLTPHSILAAEKSLLAQ